MTGDDYRWEHMSVMERCEVLREGQARIERDLKALFIVADSNIKTDTSIARRVAEIEKGGKADPRFPAGLPTADVHIPTDRNARVFERVFIDAAELARLRRVEAAARDAVAFHTPSFVESMSFLRKIREALDSEPER